MEFKILVKTPSGREWWEDYDEETNDPKAWAEETIAWFNKTLKPGEESRELVEVVIVDGANEKFHQWIKRTDGMSSSFRGRIADLMYCEKCKITGKRFGLKADVIIDSKYRKKAFKECHTSTEEMRRRG